MNEFKRLITVKHNEMTAKQKTAAKKKSTAKATVKVNSSGKGNNFDSYDDNGDDYDFL